MALATTLSKRSKTSGVLNGIFSLTFSGSYSTGGEALDLSTLIGFTNRRPDFVEVVGVAGYIYKYDYANKKVLVYIPTTPSTNAPFAQHSAATYDAAVSGDTVKLLAFWFATPSGPGI